MISDFLNDRAGVGSSGWRTSGASEGVSSPISESISSGVSNGIRDFLEGPAGDATDQAFGMSSGGGSFSLRDIFGRGPRGEFDPSYGSKFSDVGAALSYGGLAPTGAGFIGNAIGSVVDMTNANKSLGAAGAASLGLGDYLEGVLANSLGPIGRAFGLRDIATQRFDNMHALGYSDYFALEDPSYSYGFGMVDQWGQPTYGMAAPEAPEVYGPNDYSTYIDSLGNPWSGPDGSGLGARGGESANDTGGGWSGGSSDRDIESGGDW